MYVPYLCTRRDFFDRIETKIRFPIKSFQFDFSIAMRIWAIIYILANSGIVCRIIAVYVIHLMLVDIYEIARSAENSVNRDLLKNLWPA